MYKNLLCIAIILFASIPLASATEFVIDTAHHHIGDNFKEELTPNDPEGTTYTKTFNLDSVENIESAGLRLVTKSIVPSPTDEFLDKVYLNGIELGTLNDYILAQTQDNEEIDISIPVDPTILKSGINTVKITSGSNAYGSNYDDFEFYNLAMHITESVPITIEPPLKVAWTYELSSPFSAPPLPVSLIAENVIYIAENGIKAIDANTGKLLWNKESDANLAYNEGVLFAVHSTNIDALDAKTGKLLWSKEYLMSGGNPVIFGDTLYVSTSSDKYVFAIGTENGNLKWKYELNITEFETGGRNSYSLSNPVVNGNIVVFRYYAHHSSYAGPPIAIKEGEPEPELEKTIEKEGLIAINTKTGKEIWKYEGKVSKPFVYKDLVYTTLANGNVIARSTMSGEEVWKAKVGDWANMVAVKNGKLFVASKKPVILDARSGKILKEYQNPELSFSESEITDKYIFTATSGRNKIQVFDINTGELVWKGGKARGYFVSAPTLYKDKLYLTSDDGKLYAFEHGKERFAIEDTYIYLATLAILFLLGAIAYKKRLIAYKTTLRIKNKVLRGVIIGATPFIIIAISLLYVSIVEEYFHGMIQEGMALGLAMGFVFSLIAAVIFGIIGGVLGYISDKFGGTRKL